ncbi:MAG: hypothetical protein IJ927_03795 [Eubacterium sp.]|nr:hypothetical protein [Eubacterium sp.]
MSNLWIINLKDNRDGSNKNDDTKFNICKKEKFVAFGWVTPDKRTQANYNKADRAFSKMRVGDYVWTKNPKTKSDFYLLEIIDDEIKDYLIEGNTYFLDNDISKSIKVNQIKEYHKNILPPGISKRDIVARSTIEQVHREHLIKATQKII